MTINLMPPSWPSYGKSLLEVLAIFIYETARLQADAMDQRGVVVPPPWADRDLAFQLQFLDVVKMMMGPDRKTSAAELHADWVRAYERMGWRYGPIRSESLKTHPDMVDWDDLSRPNQIKDEVFVDICEMARKHILPVWVTTLGDNVDLF